MKRVRPGVVVLCGLLGLGHATAAAQSRPDFSGSWQSSEAKPLAITQTAQTLTVSEGSDTRTFNLDGSETRYERVGTNFTSNLTSQVRWVGSALLVTTTTVSPVGTWQGLEVYSLDYGEKLTVVRVFAQTTAPLMGTIAATYMRQ